jgi:hypothetical protein
MQQRSSFWQWMNALRVFNVEENKAVRIRNHRCTLVQHMYVRLTVLSFAVCVIAQLRMKDDEQTCSFTRPAAAGNALRRDPCHQL